MDHNRTFEATRSRWLRVEWVLLAALVVAALALRLYRLDTFPDTLNPDEADNAQDALRVIFGSPNPGGFFSLDWKPQPAYSIYLIALSLHLLEPGVLAVRLPSALIGALGLIPFYALCRRQLTAPAAYGATILLGTNLWLLHFARSGWENVQVPTYAMVAMWCLLGANDLLRAGRTGWRLWALFAGAGVACALGLYSYFSGRLIYLSLLLVAPALLLSTRGRWKTLVQGYVLLTVVAVILFAPMLPVTMRDQAFFNQRSSTVLILNSPEMAEHPGEVWWGQITRTSAVLWDGSYSNNPRYNPPFEPLLDPLTRWLTLAGMVLSLLVLRLRGAPETWLWWSLLLVGWFFTQVLTTGTPDGARGTICGPALFFFAGVSLDWLDRLLARRGTWPRALLLASLGLFVVAAGVTNVLRYVEWQSSQDAREMRQPYVRVDEFPAWVVMVHTRVERGDGLLNAAQWRTLQDGVPPGMGPVAEPAAASQDPPPGWPQAQVVIEASAAWPLAEPRAAAFDDDGNLYVLDSAPTAQTITSYDPAGKPITRWGGPGEPDQEGRFVGAWAITVTADEVLVLDSETGWVHVFDRSGAFRRRVGGPQLGVYMPRALAVSPHGSLYVADTGGGRLLELDQRGAVVREIGSTQAGAEGAGLLREPAGVAVAPDGTLYVADALAGVIRRYLPDGAFVGVWPINPDAAHDGPRIAAFGDGSVIVSLPSRCSIVRLDADGQILAILGGCDAAPQPRHPTFVAVSPNGRYAFGDLERSAVQIFALADRP
jgi:4-amino-4-deoxy-L-arabinose transferase-like glycosyltransferase